MTTITLERFKVMKLSQGQAKYTGVDTDGDGRRDEWRSNWRTVYVQRAPGKPDNVSLVPLDGYVKLLTDEEVDAVKRVAAKHKWQLSVKRSDLVFERDAYPNLGGDIDCEPELLRALQLVAGDLSRKEGRKVTIWIRSGRRTMAEQWQLYNQLGPGIAAYPSLTAPHVRGVAADCGIDGVNIGAYKGGAAKPFMLNRGVCLRVAHENWHVERGPRSRWAPNHLPT